ncbi:hypothetical protein QP381_05680 [Pauljensenia sp. UMB6358]|nr:hypothetical protein [Pauljensenia sp. UMB6358]MDK7122583.1 hypothetical protein [Pauljensenia sp. UMB6358]
MGVYHRTISQQIRQKFVIVAVHVDAQPLVSPTRQRDGTAGWI